MHAFVQMPQRETCYGRIDPDAKWTFRIIERIATNFFFVSLLFRHFLSLCFFSFLFLQLLYITFGLDCRKKQQNQLTLLCDRFSECPHVSGSILTRPKIVVLTSPVKKVTKKKRERRGHSRVAVFFFFSLFILYAQPYWIDRGEASLKSPVGILIIHFFFPLYLLTKYQILKSELILYRYGKVIIFFFPFRYHNNLTQKAATNL